MTFNASFAHTNLVAREWRALADFYRTVFGCVIVPPVRNLTGEALERGTAIPGASLEGVHLLLPGFGDHGPTLEIFQYSVRGHPHDEAPEMPAPNRPGYGHIAFRVSDIDAARSAVLKAGGRLLGEIVSTAAGDRTVTWIYMRDPEGNLIELQTWA